MPKALGLMGYLTSKVLVLDCGCWLWIGGTDSTGYGQVCVDNIKRPAHCVFYELLIGPIPNGLQLDHTCHKPISCKGGITCLHRRCVNPDHLEPVTQKENLRRGHQVSGLYQLAKTHCPHGHEYTPDNTRLKDGRRRSCRTCHRLEYKKQRNRRTLLHA